REHRCLETGPRRHNAEEQARRQQANGEPSPSREEAMNRKTLSAFGKIHGRRAFLAGSATLLATPFIARLARADAKAFRISTPGSPEEWQSKGLEVFKKELEAALPGQFDVQIFYNG